jgi:V/A-type H+-transporting ATPase subunit C
MTRADNYAYAIAYIKALRSHLLSGQQYDTLLKAKDDQDVLRGLGDTVYSTHLSKFSGKALNLVDIDSVIFEDYYRILREFRTASTTEQARQLLETTYVRHESSCLKIIMRLVKAGAPLEESTRLVTPIGRYTNEYVLKLLKTKDLRQLFTEIDDPMLKAIALDRLAECEKIDSSLPVEMAIDNYHLGYLWSIASKLDYWDKDAAKDIIGTEIDTANMSLILRAKPLGIPFSALRHLLVPIRYKLTQEVETAVEAATAADAMRVLSAGYYGNIISNAITECEQKQSMLTFEVALKRYFAERCSRAFLGYPFTAGPLLAFFNLKYFEALDIRTLFLGKRDKTSPEVLLRLLLSPSIKRHD